MNVVGHRSARPILHRKEREWMSDNQPCGKRFFSNHDGCGEESGRQKVGPKHPVFIEKNGILAFSNLSRPRIPEKYGLVSFGKSSEK
jgi:hypothetical protein